MTILLHRNVMGTGIKEGAALCGQRKNVSCKSFLIELKIILEDNVLSAAENMASLKLRRKKIRENEGAQAGLPKGCHPTEDTMQGT
jgi:hypothetical protein